MGIGIEVGSHFWDPLLGALRAPIIPDQTRSKRHGGRWGSGYGENSGGGCGGGARGAVGGDHRLRDQQKPPRTQI
jgi:hypothetical protein